MTVVWTDSNIWLRFLTRRPSQRWRRTSGVLRRAEAGELLLHVPVVVVAELVAVLHRSFDRSLAEIARVLTGLLAAEGIRVEDDVAVLEASHLVGSVRVDFVDAYVAVKARNAGDEIAFCDADFARRLGAIPFELSSSSRQERVLADAPDRGLVKRDPSAGAPGAQSAEVRSAILTK